MPLIGLRPTKARLVMEEEKDSVLVMKVVLDDGEVVELSTGGWLQDLGGVLRIRERKGTRNGAIGSIVYVGANGDTRSGAPKFQVNVGMASDKFATLLRAANAGRLPAKFIVDAGARKGAEARALDFRMRAGVRVKAWDNHAFRMLPVTNFVMILPLDLATTTSAPIAAGQIGGPAPGYPLDPAAPGSPATNAQVAELMDDMLMFQSDTRNTVLGVLCVIGVVAVTALVIAIGVYFR
ncbi:MAG: hypothetical protein U1F54_02645 [Burkholderiales bacterium]